MPRAYSSFVLRCWRLSLDEQRIEIEHVQSGHRTRVAALDAAVDWIAERWRRPAGDPDASGTGADRDRGDAPPA